MSGPAALRVAILGSGAMGSLVGGQLAGSGVPVTLLDVDAAHIDAITQGGLRMSTDAGEAVVRPAAMRPDQLHEPPDLVIVLTKQPHTRAALAALRPALTNDTWVMTLQNGLGNQELIEEFIPRERVLLGVTTYPADLLGPGHVSSHGEGEIRLMTANGVPHPIADRIAAMLNRSGQVSTVDPNLALAIWSKVAFNCAMNSICALTGSLVGQLGASPEGRQLALEVADEVVAVAGKSGVAVDGNQVRATIEHAMDTHLSHKPSMLQDMLAHRPTEIASINGAVAATAARAGQLAPRNATLYALIRLAESLHGATTTVRK